MHISQILTHLGEDRKKYFNATAPPVIQTSNFVFDDLNQFRTVFSDELENHVYSRGNNPTNLILRKKIAALEKAEDALIFSSGVAAISASIVSNVKAGDHIICVDSPYSWTKNLIVNWLSKFGVTHTFVDGTNMENIKKAIQENTTLLVLESPNSLTFEIQDLEACAKLAKQNGIITTIDNSYSSPLFQNPIEWGIDIVTHTISKYLNGHSDVVAGVLCSNKKMVRKIFELEYMTFGGILAPHDANLVIRGLRTLELRLNRSFESAMKVARYLEDHPKVEKVLYPFLPSFPQYELAKKQMKGCGGLMSIYLKANTIEQVEEFVHKLERFLMAVSWGGHESLALPIAGFYKIPGREDSPLPWNLVRLYIGLEDADWLIEDLGRALEAM